MIHKINSQHPHGFDAVEIIQVPGPQLDDTTAPRLLQRTREALEHGVQHLVIDMRRVLNMDSMGVTALALMKQRAPVGTRIVLADMGKRVQVVSRVTQLHTLFDIYADADAALRSFNRRAA